MPYVDTKPPASTPADHAQWETERKLRGESRFHGDRTMRDTRVTWAITWLAGILGTIVTVASIWGEQPSQAILLTQLVNGMGRFDFGMGAALLQNDDEYNSGKFCFALSARYRVMDRVTLEWTAIRVR